MVSTSVTEATYIINATSDLCTNFEGTMPSNSGKIYLSISFFLFFYFLYQIYELYFIWMEWQ